MSDRLRAYRRTHPGPAWPLVELHRALRAQARPAPGDVERLAGELGLPAASVRALASYYSELAARPEARRVCMGTSCALAGAAQVRAAVAAQEPCETVYCLGYCDRSPALLEAGGGVTLPGRPIGLRPGAVAAEPGPPSIRSLAAQPIVTRNILRGSAADLESARRRGVYLALERGIAQGSSWVLAEMERSGERGRGGAGFPTARKWRRAAETPGPRVVVANGDEGDPGSFVDRVLMELDPHSVLEGMALCGLAVGAEEGILFIRGEYPRALARMERAVAEARAAGILGEAVLGSSCAFDVVVFPAQGSYVCGEETALLNAVEGLRGEVRLRPPYPAEAGLLGRPTVVNNVETLVNVPWIVARGGEAYRALGTPASAGTKALCLSQGFARPGILEVDFGTSLARVVEEAGGGRGGRRLDFVLLGGPMGSIVSRHELDQPICYGAMAERGVVLGHGGLVAVLEGADLAALLLNWLEFFRDESCGRCVPCRLGSQRAVELARADLGEAGRGDLERLLALVEETSLCAFGQLTPRPLRNLLTHLARGTGSDGGRP